MKLGNVNTFSLYDIASGGIKVIVQISYYPGKGPTNISNRWFAFGPTDSLAKVENIISKETKIAANDIKIIGNSFSNHIAVQSVPYHTIHWFSISDFFFRIVQPTGMPNYFLLVSINEFAKPKTKIERYWEIIPHQPIINLIASSQLFQQIHLKDLSQKITFQFQWNFFTNNTFKKILNSVSGMQASSSSDTEE